MTNPCHVNGKAADHAHANVARIMESRATARQIRTGDTVVVAYGVHEGYFAFVAAEESNRFWEALHVRRLEDDPRSVPVKVFRDQCRPLTRAENVTVFGNNQAKR